MPVGRRHAQKADLRTQAADKMQIDVQYVFFLPTSRNKPVLAIWTEGWTEEEIQRVRALKSEMKALAATFGAKVYMTPIHPHENEEYEGRRRKARGPAYRLRQGVKRRAAEDARIEGEDERIKDRIASGVDIVDAHRQKNHRLRREFDGNMRKRRYKALANANGEGCAECGMGAFANAPLEVDHIKCLSHGGNNDLSNLQLLCNLCHKKKSAMELR
jgi:5-methylcytosine-specific restriction endonuclease McrA